MKRLLILFAMLFASPALAVLPDEQLKDPALEARARGISAELRCVVCQNQSIDESDAPLARDLRLIVRERLEAGDSDEQVKTFVVERYGTYVLLRPPFDWTTAALWAGPFVLLVGAGIGLVLHLRRRSRAAPAAPALTADEQAELDRLLGKR